MAKGVIKFFDRSRGKGYGFVIDEAGQEFFFPLAVVIESGFSSHLLAPGVEVEFKIDISDGRFRVKSFSLIAGMPSKALSVVREQRQKAKQERLQPGLPPLAVGDKALGKIKFFNSHTSYGFLEIIDPPGFADVFLHINDVPEAVCDGYPICGERFWFEVLPHEEKIKAKLLERHFESEDA